MPNFQLAETITPDHLIHQGIFFKPKKPTSTALLWVHGLTSTFYSNVKLLNIFAQVCEKEHFGFASFNNRGHDMLTSIKKIDKKSEKGYSRISGGAGVEKFEESIFDIEAGIDFLTNQGFTNIILVGHSTGANKVCYYAGSKRDKNVAGVILASPMSDRLDQKLNPQKLQEQLKHMQKLMKEGKGDELLTGYHFFPTTPKRFLSSFTKNSLEDQFDYGDPQPKLTYFRKIKKPLLVLLSENDEYLDRPVEKVKKVFDKYTHSTNYLSIILPNALHSFNGTEEEVVNAITTWITQISRS